MGRFEKLPPAGDALPEPLAPTGSGCSLFRAGISGFGNAIENYPSEIAGRLVEKRTGRRPKTDCRFAHSVHNAPMFEFSSRKNGRQAKTPDCGATCVESARAVLAQCWEGCNEGATW